MIKKLSLWKSCFLNYCLWGQATEPQVLFQFSFPLCPDMFSRKHHKNGLLSALCYRYNPAVLFSHLARTCSVSKDGGNISLLMFQSVIHLFSPSFGLLPSAINQFALHPPSCTSGEVGPLPFPPLCIWGMWHATDPTHTHTRTHTERSIPPKADSYSRCAEQHFWRPHTQTVTLALLLSWEEI